MFKGNKVGKKNVFDWFNLCFNTGIKSAFPGQYKYIFRYFISLRLAVRFRIQFVYSGATKDSSLGGGGVFENTSKMVRLARHFQFPTTEESVEIQSGQRC